MGQSSRRRRRARQQGPPPKRNLRATIDSFGGPLVIGAIVVGVLVVVALVWLNRGDSVETSDSPLLGEEIAIGPATHVQTLDEMEIVAGRPPVGGPHFPVWLEPAISTEPVNDGNAVHSLEHGMIWLSYNPELITEADLDGLRTIAREFDNDVVLSPRPDNEMAIAAASWGRLLSLDALDGELLRDFVTTNRNRSPEPGIRGGGMMSQGSGE